MSRAQVFYLHVTLALTTLTGLVFAAMKYWMKGEDEFAAANHPWQPHMLSAHVVIAPILLFVIGWAFGNHILPKLRFGGDEGNRRSGIWSMLLIAPMTLSAYLMQIATNDAIRKAMAISHWVTSAIFLIGYVAHLLAKPPKED